MPEKYRILVTDDSTVDLATLRDILCLDGYSVTTADSGENAVEIIESEKLDLVITELVMDESSGFDILRKTKEKNPGTAVIILTGKGDMMTAIEALRLHADDYLLKSCDPEEIRARVRQCLEEVALKRKKILDENILPVCCLCKRVRDDSANEPGHEKWLFLEDFIMYRTNIRLSSTYCPACYSIASAEIDNS